MRANHAVDPPAPRTRQTHSQDGPSRHSMRAHSQLQTTTTRRKSYLHPAEPPQSPTIQTRLAIGDRSPAYLRGKNPYGTVLGTIEHPYRDTRLLRTGPPSQSGAGPGGRLRTAGAFRFKTRNPSTQPESAANEQASSSRHLNSEQAIESSSVKAAKSLFERDDTRSPLALHPQPPEQPSAVEDAPPKRNGLQDPSLSLVQSKVSHRSRVHTEHSFEADIPKPGTTSIPRLSSSTRAETSQLDDPSIRTTASGPRARNMTGRADKGGAPNDARNPSSAVAPTSRTQLNKADDPGSHTGTTVHQVTETVSEGHGQRQAPDKTVRSRGEHSYSTATEREEDAEAGAGQRYQQQSESERSHRHVRGNVEKDRQLELTCLGQTGPGFSSNVESIPFNCPHDRVLSWTRSVSPKSFTRQDMRSHHDHVGIKLETHGPERYGTARKLPDNHRAIGPTLSQDDSARDVTHTANVGVQLGYDEMQVPDHIDWRAAYGRRKTQDFGFPGARIKPHRTNWNQRPPEASTHDAGSGSRFPQTASIRINRTIQAHSLFPAGETQEDPYEVKEPRRWKQGPGLLFKSSIARSSSAICGEQHRPSQMPSDKCGDRLADTLGYMIDDLLQEHSDSLQQVIDNMEEGQRDVPRLQRSPDKIEMHTGLAYTTYQPPRTHDEIVRLQRTRHQPKSVTQEQFIAWLQEHRWRPPFSQFPPTQAERLNVGATGQVRPNVNDSYHVLRQSLQTVEDLVNLVESVADNFGVDLKRRPTASDDERYHGAPYEWD